MNNLLEIQSLNKTQLTALINRSIDFSKNKKQQLLKNKRLALLFSEVSLRTKMSFKIGMQLLGGIATTVSIPHLTKEFDGTNREDFLDILKSLEGWVDAFVIRDYTGKLLEMSLKHTNLPIIDGFCGLNHPTQTIADLAIIQKEFKKIKNLKICCVCPPFGSGVMESFAYGGIIMGADIYFLTPESKYSSKNKSFNKKIKALGKKWGGKLTITTDIKVALSDAKILYVDEWWKNTKNFLDIKLGKLKVDNAFLQNALPNIKIMHYLPAHHDREITKEILHSKKSIAFEQAEFRLYSAMASLEYIFNR
ncbi:hypothetical protein A2533_04705 [Candidatus Falkowbacteria bacterium RIFOXYD2_FULL_35_9]|uniref:Ornithine carbamoyltransferase n=1 Tax=Candidatus Falkowbacteria bacterium RIFOXYC2_FULL_36_12 TaxID=1798002 RepID=A0A1F5T399_9BACT|nr:MAG: hypothetical protein A2478_01680 [Candidatus Falkowbacteria bacterium RIFOXYC2_FULL_36_12]OGF33947.1 MAG: hypothetical protein A2223_03290 [Candidatus Falkowbacteria bacterium RIFOXYA2_FULL_35_8]OGF46073.1 MAG: hypothetical protein A2533_04705 [Candidatus Falkowbacteria bacterium RIFOXYD2_FULL_35_9]